MPALDHKAPAREENRSWGDEWAGVADVIIVGSGAAGLSAALGAATKGSKVLVLERGEHAGGTTAKSSGTMWIPNNPLMQKAGISDPRLDALRFLSKVSFPDSYSSGEEYFGLTPEKFRLLETFYDQGTAAFEDLHGLGAIPIETEQFPSYPDYHADLPENKAPEGRSLRIRLPEGHRRGIDATGGQILVESMLEACRKLGVEILLGQRVDSLVTDESGAVVGVEARSRRGTSLYGSARGVVFATGGFIHDKELSATFLRGPVLGSSAAVGATGDFVRIGMQAGAKLGNMSHAWWDQVVLESALRSRATSRDCVYPFGDSMVIVDKFGRRVMNEKMAYNERGQVHSHWNPDRREYSNFLLFMIFDDCVMKDTRPSPHRFPVPDENGGSENVLSGDTLAELSGKILARVNSIADRTGEFRLAEDFATELRETIERFNRMSVAGKDEDFRRGETPIEAAWATAPRSQEQLNPTMHAFAAEGPYHCVILGPGALDTKGGPVTDETGRILRQDDTPIVGLYGAGNCVASPTGQGYYGPGGTIGPGLTFGYIAGTAAAGEPPRRPSWS
ncbi:FAD-dependent oxidoreductase [Specibacter sp. RAF43]|uniref:FAD-dependent oxidoreductase n=1 Tax=Specibacter sp. RAF43 TaxID=3233057 RepID=UPI003F967B04